MAIRTVSVLQEKGTADRECVFCRIVRHELPAERLYESEKVLAILDIQPIHFGHSLIIPKKHCIDFLSIPESDLHDVLHIAQIITRAMVKALGLEGFNIFSNNGKVAGQSVFHFHLHVTPRFAGDDIRFMLNLKHYEQGGLAQYGELIRSHISPD